jgi:hypothetical protein
LQLVDADGAKAVPEGGFDRNPLSDDAPEEPEPVRDECTQIDCAGA